ncbi:hypothetical protein H0H93_014107, partial [Arthromyces matolae]
HNAPWNLARLNTGERPLEDQNPKFVRPPLSEDSLTSITAISTLLSPLILQQERESISMCSVDFGGRARWGATFVPSDDNDVNGHGTHCAGTAAGSRFGAAKRASIIAVKVLDDNNSGTASGV